ncbi:OmpA family protein [Larkinella ripae]
MNEIIKRGFLIVWLISTGGLVAVRAQKIVQRDVNPLQRTVEGGGQVTKIEYSNHKMVVYFVSDNQTRKPRLRSEFSHSSQTVYGPGHPNSWRLYDKKGNREYALLYIKNIKAILDNGQVEEVAILDEAQAARFDFAEKISCEAHFERPAKNVDAVDLIEEDVRFYKSRTGSQQPYNVYDLRVLAYTEDQRNTKPPVKKPPVPSKTKPAVPPVKKPAPTPAPKDTVLAQTLPKEDPKPAPAEKVENFGAKVEAGRTYRLNNLLFQQSAYRIEPESYPELDSLVAIMKRNPVMAIELAGHTDNVGDAKLNVALSQKRVDAVKSYLTSKAIEPARIQTQAYGGSKPIADNAREETKRLNRRVEVKILKS